MLSSIADFGFRFCECERQIESWRLSIGCYGFRMEDFRDSCATLISYSRWNHSETRNWEDPQYD
jgi:hypothetical protein